MIAEEGSSCYVVSTTTKYTNMLYECLNNDRYANDLLKLEAVSLTLFWIDILYILSKCFQSKK